MSPAERQRVAVKCGRLGEALSAFYQGKGGNAEIRRLYDSWFDWAARLSPRETRLVVNDYRTFRDVSPGDLDRELPPESA